MVTPIEHEYGHLTDRIRQAFPQADLSHASMNVDGQVNLAIITPTWVYRFARDTAAQALLRHEATVLDVVRQYVELAVPAFEFVADDFVAYPLIPGEPLLRDDILTWSVLEQDRLLGQLAQFLQQVHAIPHDRLTQTGIRRSGGRQSQAEWLALYDAVRSELFPLMYRATRQWVDAHFAPLLRDDHWLDFQPALIHDDLANYHILMDRRTHRINGILDFGTAGLGDPARDYAILLHVYGETLVRRMAGWNSQDQDWIDRARFYSGTFELQWVLAGVRTKSFDWFTAHLDRARDVLPYGALRTSK